MEELQKKRTRIDEIDTELIKLINDEDYFGRFPPN
ncbi:MAG: hypothetical protein RBG13Loki_1680 [Promethearchaeota archaeon CR_4]|nr:MAG: hypothetical protein RBG13Loki_1680 [Candidatus Lokiarchaeota archaeon CR_4]